MFKVKIQLRVLIKKCNQQQHSEQDSDASTVLKFSCPLSQFQQTHEKMFLNWCHDTWSQRSVLQSQTKCQRHNHSKQCGKPKNQNNSLSKFSGIISVIMWRFRQQFWNTVYQTRIKHSACKFRESFLFKRACLEDILYCAFQGKYLNINILCTIFYFQSFFYDENRYLNVFNRALSPLHECRISASSGLSQTNIKQTQDKQFLTRPISLAFFCVFASCVYK